MVARFLSWILFFVCRQWLDYHGCQKGNTEVIPFDVMFTVLSSDEETVASSFSVPPGNQVGL